MEETEKYANLITAISTDFLMKEITEEHYKNTLEMTINKLLGKKSEKEMLHEFADYLQSKMFNVSHDSEFSDYVEVFLGVE